MLVKKNGKQTTREEVIEQMSKKTIIKASKKDLSHMNNNIETINSKLNQLKLGIVWDLNTQFKPLIKEETKWAQLDEEIKEKIYGNFADVLIKAFGNGIGKISIHKKVENKQKIKLRDLKEQLGLIRVLDYWIKEEMKTLEEAEKLYHWQQFNNQN